MCVCVDVAVHRCLSYYIRCHFADAKSSDSSAALTTIPASPSAHDDGIRLYSGEVVSWSDVSTFFANRKLTANKKHIDSDGWRAIRYIYNPSFGRLTSLFGNRCEGIEAPINKRLRLLCSPLHFVMCLRFLLDERVTRLGLLAEKVAQWQVEFTASKKTSAYKNVTALAGMFVLLWW